MRNLIVYIKQDGSGVTEQWLTDPDGSDRRLLTATGGGAFWSHDGQWLYSMEGPPTEDGIWSTVKLNLDTGETLPVGDEIVGLMITSDGSTGYFSPSTARVGEVWNITPVEGGIRTPLRTDLGPRVPLIPHEYALSPDDAWLATPLMDQGTTNLWLISTADGALRQVTDFQHEPTLICREVSWSSDSRYVFAALMKTSADIVLIDIALP
jgi:Tol biopolymer transport system component